MNIARNSIAAAVSLALIACGGGGGSGGGGSPIQGGGTPTPTPTSASCSLSARQDFARAVIDEWYLFPELVATNVSKASFNDVQGYLDALVAPARAQAKDRSFTYVTSIREETAFFNSGSSAGFGVRLSYDTTANRVFITEAFEGAPGLAQGLDRGVELLAIGNSASGLLSVSSLMASGGHQAVSNALGPSEPGVTRVLRIREVSGAEREITVAKADFALDPVSNRYGARILDDNGKKVGYLNLRTFIDTADADLRNAVDGFRQQGVTEVIVDVRYNGGGLVRIAELLGDLLGRDRVGQVFSRTTLRPSKSGENETDLFGAQSQAIAATKIAFIGTGSTASASELVANAFIPYLQTNTALVGANTFGKPVGQFAFDRAECDDRIRAVTFKTDNAAGQGEYFTGLASVMPVTCRAADDISVQLGEPNEASIATALQFLRGGSAACSRITANGQDATASAERQAGLVNARRPLIPARPTAAQRETPGLF